MPTPGRGVAGSPRVGDADGERVCVLCEDAERERDIVADRERVGATDVERLPDRDCEPLRDGDAEPLGERVPCARVPDTDVEAAAERELDADIEREVVKPEEPLRDSDRETERDPLALRDTALVDDGDALRLADNDRERLPVVTGVTVRERLPEVDAAAAREADDEPERTVDTDAERERVALNDPEAVLVALGADETDAMRDRVPVREAVPEAVAVFVGDAERESVGDADTLRLWDRDSEGDRATERDTLGVADTLADCVAEMYAKAWQQALNVPLQGMSLSRPDDNVWMQYSLPLKLLGSPPFHSALSTAKKYAMDAPLSHDQPSYDRFMTLGVREPGLG